MPEKTKNLVSKKDPKLTESHSKEQKTATGNLIPEKRENPSWHAWVYGGERNPLMDKK